MRIEMHVHTRYSNDSLLPLMVIYYICKVKKISCIAITDHNTIKGALRFKEKFEKKGIKVIIGEEIMTSKGEIIGLFLNNEIKKGMTPEETIDEIIKQEGLVYIPHPFDLKRIKTVLEFDEIEKNRNKISFIEAHNGRNVSEYYTEKQKEIAEKLNITKVIGSDAHTIFEIGRNFMEIDEFDTKEEFIKKISQGKFKQKPCLKICHLITKLTKLIKYIIRGDLDELFRIIDKKIRRRMFTLDKRNKKRV